MMAFGDPAAAVAGRPWAAPGSVESREDWVGLSQLGGRRGSRDLVCRVSRASRIRLGGIRHRSRDLGFIEREVGIDDNLVAPCRRLWPSTSSDALAPPWMLHLPPWLAIARAVNVAFAVLMGPSESSAGRAPGGAVAAS